MNLIFILIPILLSVVHGGTILLTCYPAGRSHGYVAARIGHELVARGHKVVFLASDQDAPVLDLKGFTVVDYPLGFDIEEMNKVFTSLKLGDDVTFINAILDANEKSQVGILATYEKLKDMNIDLVIMDWTVSYVTLLVSMLKVPYIHYCPLGLALDEHAFNPFVDFGRAPSFPGPYRKYPMSAVDSVINFASKTFFIFICDYVLDRPKHKARAQKGLESHMKYLQDHEIVYHQLPMSLNWDYHKEREIPDHMEISGPILPRAAKALPLEFQNLLNSKEKFILFSLGTIVSSTEDPVKAAGLQKLVDAVGTLKEYTVIFKKFNDKIMMPKNFYPVKYMPQNDLLAHPKVKMFVTHGGFNSFVESLYHGTPMVVFPGMADQGVNAVRTEHLAKAGRYVDMDMSFETLQGIMEEVVTDPKFSQNAQTISNELKQTPGAKKIAEGAERVLNGYRRKRRVDDYLSDFPFGMFFLDLRPKFNGIPVALISWGFGLVVPFLCCYGFYAALRCCCGSKKKLKQG